MHIPMSDIWKIDGKPLPQPSAMEVGMEDVHSPNSGRDAAGRMQIDVIRFGVRSVSFTYEVLAQEQLGYLLGLLCRPFYMLTYPDPERGPATLECYVPSRKADLYSGVLYAGLWREITFTCIER